MSKLGKEGHKRHFRKVFKSLNDKIVNSASSPSLSQEEKCEKQNLRCSKFKFERNLEREETSL